MTIKLPAPIRRLIQKSTTRSTPEIIEWLNELRAEMPISAQQAIATQASIDTLVWVVGEKAARGR